MTNQNSFQDYPSTVCEAIAIGDYLRSANVLKLCKAKDHIELKRAMQ